jgi:long-subunit acyl-CoA synthetase (AMP-forming)
MQQSLFAFLDQNHTSSLLFIDAETKQEGHWQEMILPLPFTDNENKKLAFLYLDNSLTSVQAILTLLKSKHAVCLLSNELGLTLKQSLESLYKPDFIFDKTRADLESAPVWKKDDFELYAYASNGTTIHSDLKILLATSGTTGSHKFVKLTEPNFIANTLSILDYLPISPEDSCILNLPIHYSYGLSILLTNIARGGKIVCSNETVISRNFWTLFKEYNCNSLAGVPYTYDMLLRIGFTKMEGLNLKYLTQAGGKLNEKSTSTLAEFSTSASVRFYVMYGQTEATARMSYLDPSNLQEKLGSIGKPIKNGTFRIDPQSSELIYSGPNVGCGYAETRQDLTACAPQPELFTGDMARFDADNFFYLTGRLKRFVKLFGNRINLDELENDMKQTFSCLVGCIGLEDKNLLVFSDSPVLKAKELQNFIFDKYKIHPSVIKYFWLKTIPLTSTHKINYQAISAAYEH